MSETVFVPADPVIEPIFVDDRKPRSRVEFEFGLGPMDWENNKILIGGAGAQSQTIEADQRGGSGRVAFEFGPHYLPALLGTGRFEVHFSRGYEGNDAEMFVDDSDIQYRTASFQKIEFVGIGTAANPSTFRTDSDLDWNRYDMETAYRWNRDRSGLLVTLGLRYANLTNDVDLVEQVADVNRQSIFHRQRFDGFGPAIGAEGYLKLGRIFYLYGVFDGSYLGGHQFRASHYEIDDDTRLVSYYTSGTEMWNIGLQPGIGLSTQWRETTLGLRFGVNFQLAKVNAWDEEEFDDIPAFGTGLLSQVQFVLGFEVAR